MELKDGENPSSPAPLGAPSKHGGRTAFNVYAEAVEHLSTLRTKNKLSNAEFDLLTTATGFDDVVQLVLSTQLRTAQERDAVGRFIERTTKAVVMRLERFTKAIDMMVQSTKVAGIIWGAFKFLLLVCLARVQSGVCHKATPLLS
jgi:hypothetical protein